MGRYLSLVNIGLSFSMAGTYHHGDLRQALLDAGAEALDEGGVGGLTLGGLARRVGVGAAAPYHYFEGKAGLVAALSEHALDASLATVIDTDDDPARRLQALGVAYVAFALDYPERFRLAFRPEWGWVFDGMAGWTPPEDQATFRQLIRVTRAIEPDPALQVEFTVAAWAFVHGIAALLVDGPLGGMVGDRDHALVFAGHLIDRFGTQRLS